MSDRFHWARLLAFVSGLVNQELLLRNEYLAAENRILRSQPPSRLRLSDAERSTLSEIAKRLGRKALKERRALRGVADRLSSILIALLKTGQPYDAKRRQNAAASADTA